MLIPKYVLEGLDDLSVENLRLGRITKEAMSHAFSRAAHDRYYVIGSVDTTSCRILADELNDLLEAARQLDK